MVFLHKQITINTIPGDYLSLINKFRGVDIRQIKQLFSFIETLPHNHLINSLIKTNIYCPT